MTPMEMFLFGLSLGLFLGYLLGLLMMWRHMDLKMKGRLF